MPGRMLSYAAVLLCGSASAQPQLSPKTAETSLTDLVKELREKNPEVRAARYRFDAATKRPSQAGSLPDPKLSVSNFGVGYPVSKLNDSNFAYRGIGMTQEIPFPGKLALASEQAKKESESEREMYSAALRDVTSRLKIAYFEWASVAKQLEVTTRNRDLLQRFEEIARNRYSVGKGIQQEVLKAQVELSSLAQELELLQQKRATVEAQIQYLLGRDIETPLGTPAELKLSPLSSDLETLLSSAAKSSPRVRAQEFLIDSRAVGVERSKREYRPDFAVSVQWQHTGSSYPDFYMATAEVKLPLYFWRKQRFGAEEAQSRLREARESYRSTRQETAYMVKEQFLAAKSSERLLALYQSGSIPQASLALDSTTSAYEVGKVDFLTLLNSLTSVLTFEKQYYQELARHEQALARLEPLVGQELIQP
jgi:cobalt-zinc-cadmium efflux system outer membrane protein